MKVSELIAQLQTLDPELPVAVPRGDFPDDKFVYPTVRVEEMVLSGGHLTTRAMRPAAKESRGLHVTL